jgi:GNAT superfamily N-acetyltransferase
MEIFIRKMSADDAESVKDLSDQLGYPLSIGEITQNIKAVLNSTDGIAFVAEYNDKIVGWIGASQAVMIEVVPHCEINGLVIDSDLHGKGIGKHLIKKVKEWARDKGNKKLSLHCNIKRTEAHQFYSHLGFKDLKKQTNFVMDI